MELNDVILTRCSVRKFADKMIEDEKLLEVISTACVAPTAKNSQAFRIYVIRSEEGIAKIRELSRCAFNAPVVLLFTYNKEEEWKNPFEEGVTSGIEDASIVATYAMLKAAELGLGTCWVNYFPNTETEKAFGIPETERSVLLMPVGYPADDAKPSPMHDQKRPLNELVRTI
ncbi:MAG: nitroreductase family protein [Solobacterium sp.]|nr:nitroreductase family protein [Solobacterium sp.]